MSRRSITQGHRSYLEEREHVATAAAMPSQSKLDLLKATVTCILAQDQASNTALHCVNPPDSSEQA